MESMKTLPSGEEISRDLRQASVRIRGILSELAPREPKAAWHIATPRQISDLLAELRKAAKCLKTLPAHGDAGVNIEACAYRQQVEHLYRVLPGIHSALVEERARLRQRRKRVDAAAAWAEASRETIQK